MNRAERRARERALAAYERKRSAQGKPDEYEQGWKDEMLRLAEQDAAAHEHGAVEQELRAVAAR